MSISQTNGTRIISLVRGRSRKQSFFNAIFVVKAGANETLVSSTEPGSVIDGIVLDDIKEFAKQFKSRRLAMGLTQTQVGHALSAAEGPAYSQSAICRY